MNYKEDYYKILEVSENATAEEIKKAYRSLAKEYHPDKNDDSEESKQIFQKISEAYQILSDPVKRKTYDSNRKKQEKVLTPEDLSEEFKNNRKNFAKMVAVKELIDNKEKEIEKLLKEKYTLIYEALDNKYTNKQYLKKAKELIIKFETIEKYLKELKINLNNKYITQTDRIEKIIYYIDETIKEIPLDLEELKIKEDRKELENDFSYILDSTTILVNDSIKELLDLYEQVYLGNISRTEYKNIYDLLLLSYQDAIQQVKSLKEIRKKNQLCDEYKEKLNKLSFFHKKMKEYALLDKYKKAEELGKAIHDFKNDMAEYSKWQNISSEKIKKIVKIIKKYPNNKKKDKILLDYGIKLIKQEMNYFEDQDTFDIYYRKYSGLFNNLEPLEVYNLAYELKRSLPDKYKEFINNLPVEDLMKMPALDEIRNFGTPKSLISIRYDRKQLFFFKDIKTYGDFINRYKLVSIYSKVSPTAAIVCLGNFCYEAINSAITETPSSIPAPILLGPSILIFLNLLNISIINSWLKEMKNVINNDINLNKIYEHKKIIKK